MSTRPRRRRTVWAVVANLILPGIGHAVANRIARGAIWLVGAMTVAAFSLNAPNSRDAFVTIQFGLCVASALDIWILMRPSPTQKF